ncbi:talin-1-like isoform X5 [Apostichopus japonicus]|uniref:talin-1-like isoform X5 n=1 Tax=Stichopus japonicus TaxID=307972 RepID=UPI003AB5453D
MALLSLKINIVSANSTKTMQFEPATMVFDVCRMIREKIPEASLMQGQATEYGLFLHDEDPKKGVWLESGKTLEHYMLREADILEYRKKIRPLRVKMLDGSVKTVLIDDSHTASQMLVTICTKLGVTNYDEYSLCRDEDDPSDPKARKDATLNRGTLKKDKDKTSILRDEKKMDTLKRKLHTDDELNWLDHTRTLREQGVEDTETLIFRRKYFYSDQNVDKRDPVQLNLLYVQSRDAILNGTHPCSQEEATQLAGTQCQILYNDHQEAKHKAGFLDLKVMLPKEYVKIKGIEKKIFVEHKKLLGVNELDAKVRYTQLCRSLKTYGITFFLVKEKMKGKNKLVPRLLGINKESVVRVDERTKEILKTWPLTHVRRWAASPKSFTLDFGDYSEAYYSVQTTEGEQIGQLIGGYIDIILKKKKGKDRTGIEGEEEATLLEDSVSPAKATFIQHQSNSKGQYEMGSVAMPGIMRQGGQAGHISRGEMGDPLHAMSTGQGHTAHQPPMNSARQPGLTSAQMNLKSSIDYSFTTMEDSMRNLDEKHQLNIGDDEASLQWRKNEIDLNRQMVESQMSAMAAATAGIITQSNDPNERDYTVIGSHVTTISSNMTEMTKGIKMLAALLEEEDGSQNLIDATKDMMMAFKDLLNAASPETEENRQELLSAANKVAEAQSALFQAMSSTGYMEPGFQDTLMQLAKAVANATATLVLNSKNVASTAEEEEMRNQVIGEATNCALNTSQLVAVTRVVAPTISNPACQEQLVEAAKLVAKSVERVVDSSKQATEDENLLMNVGEAATAVTKALNDLLQHVKQGTAGHKPGTVYDDACDRIVVATDKLFSSVGNATEMVKQAKVLAQASSLLVGAIKGDAEGLGEGDSQQKLLGAARELADATARMIEAAKGCAGSPNDAAQQHRLRQAAEDLRSATNLAANNALKKKLITRLENAAKQAAALSTQTISAAQGADLHNTNKSSQQELIDECRVTAEHIPALVHGVRDSMNQPDSTKAQVNLINASQNFLAPGNNLVTASKAAVPTVSDPSSAMQLNNVSKNLANALAELKAAAAKAQEACGSLELDNAVEMIRTLNDELDQMHQTAEDGKLVPLPGQVPANCAAQLGSTSKGVGASMASLLTSAAQGNENHTGIAARDTANSLKSLTAAVRGVAATTTDLQSQQAIIEAAKDVMEKSVRLLEEAKAALENPNNPENQQRLAQVAKAVSQALNNCMNCLPGQRDVDMAIRSVLEGSKGLMSGKDFENELILKTTTEEVITSYTSSLNVNLRQRSEAQIDLPENALSRSYQDHQNALNQAAQGLNEASVELVSASRGTPEQLSSAAIKFSKDFQELMDAGVGMARTAPNKEAQGQMVGSLKGISVSSSKLLLAVKAMSVDPNAPNAKNQLAAAARAVTDSINQLLNTFMQSAPGQKECDNALRQIQAVKSILDNINEPINDWSYFECQDHVMAQSKALGEAMVGITKNAKTGNLPQFGHSVEKAGQAVCNLTEATAQAAYLVGISDPSSVAGRPGLVDQSQFARANQAIQAACQKLINPESTQPEVLAAATEVAKHTSALCNICRVASSKTSNPVAKKHFVQSAKDVANSTANLVKNIKDLDGNFTDVNRQNCAQATRPLLEAVDSLVTFASSPEFASVPARITPQARMAMEPIITAGKTMIASSSSLIQTAKPLGMNPDDPPTWKLLAANSKQVSDSIKNLVHSIKDRAPGQAECDEAIEKINQSIRDLDSASLEAMGSNLPPMEGNNFQVGEDLCMYERFVGIHVYRFVSFAKVQLRKPSLGESGPAQVLVPTLKGDLSFYMESEELKGFTEQLSNSAAALKDTVKKVEDAAKEHAEKLGHSVTSMANYFHPLTRNAIGAASKSINSQKQMALLDQSKTVAECALQLLYASKEGGGNPKATKVHPDIEEAAAGMLDGIQDLMNTLEETASEYGMVTPMLDSISKAIIVTDEPLPENEAGEFVAYQTDMVQTANAIIRTSQDMITKANSNVGELGTLANNLSHDYSKLSNGARGAIASTAPEVADRIKSTTQDLGHACHNLVKNAGTVQGNPTDNLAKKDLVDNARAVCEKANYVMNALQAGSRGTQACIDAASTVSGIIGDLDTTIMFASAGTLSSEPTSGAFADHRENIRKAAKALVEDTKTLVTGATANQEQLAGAAQSAVGTITQLSEVVKLGASTLGGDDPEGQVLLINAVKDVASALGDLISATKMASGKANSSNQMKQLNESAKTMVMNVTSLLKTVKSVEDEATRGTRALEATIDAIVQEAKILHNPVPEDCYATPEDLIRSTKQVTLATAKAVGAGNSCKQEDIIAASNVARQAVFEMINTCRGASNTAETPELKQRTVDAGGQCALSFRVLLQQVQANVKQPSQDGRQKLASESKRVAMSVGELVQTAELLKDESDRYGSDWVDPEDPNVIAENELLSAANAIEAAAKKLSQLRPRQKAREADESLDFEEQILEAAKAIANATSALVKAASHAQRELVQQGKVSHAPTRYSEDGQWSMGLISAARKVAAATQGLCESANALVQGHASQERLVSSAKQVAACTAQLLVACKVKADIFSEGMKRLQAAGNAVKKASEHLVAAAQQAAMQEEEAVSVEIGKKMVGNIAVEIEAQEMILKKEKELQEARRKLEMIRKAKYANKPPEDSD